MTIYQPYVYIIRWTSVNNGYIGVRYAEGCNPSDLFDSYQTSSKLVCQLISEVGLPDQIKIFPYPDKETALIFEEKFQRRFRVLESDYWLNQNISRVNFEYRPTEVDKNVYLFYNIRTNEKYQGTRYSFRNHFGYSLDNFNTKFFKGKRKKSLGWILVKSFETLEPLYDKGHEYTPKWKHNHETIEKISERTKNRKLSKEHKMKIGESRTDYNITDLVNINRRNKK